MFKAKQLLNSFCFFICLSGEYNKSQETKPIRMPLAFLDLTARKMSRLFGDSKVTYGQ